MKKTKWLIATPLMATPIIAALPVVTSCNKGPDVSISSDFAENVDVESISGKLIEGEPYIIRLSVKENKIGKQFLPNTLTKVTSGGNELEQVEEATNGYYYTYSLYENNTVGYVTILSADGPVSIEAKTAKIKSVGAVGADLISKQTVAEFEIGETLGDETTRSRILVTVTLSNSDIFVIEDTYTIALNGYKTGDTFTKVETDNKGTVTYCGVTSNEFDYRVIATTQAYLTLPNEAITKCPSITDAIETYNGNNDSGNYSITIPYSEQTYEISTATIILQKANTHLSIQSLGATLCYNGGEYGNKDYLFTINYGSEVASSNSSISFYGIRFNAPTTKATGTFNQILLGGTVSTYDQPHNISFEECIFVGDKTQTLNVNAVSSYAGSTPYGVSILSCEGYYLNALYSGSIQHNVKNIVDLTIGDCSSLYSQQICNINSSTESKVLIDGVVGSVMYTKDGSATSLVSGMTLSGVGTYWIANCTLMQASVLAEDKEHGAFIEVTTNATSTLTRQLILSNLYFIENSEETSPMHTVLNTYTTAGEDWAISYTNEEGTETEKTIVSGPTISPTSYFDIDEE